MFVADLGSGILTDTQMSSHHAPQPSSNELEVKHQPVHFVKTQEDSSSQATL